jgi:hypothetical protein
MGFRWDSSACRRRSRQVATLHLATRWESCSRPLGIKYDDLGLCLILKSTFRLDHEFVVKGNLFRKGRMKIVVSKIYKMLTQGKVDQVG